MTTKMFPNLIFQKSNRGEVGRVEWQGENFFSLTN